MAKQTGRERERERAGELSLCVFLSKKARGVIFFHPYLSPAGLLCESPACVDTIIIRQSFDLWVKNFVPHCAAAGDFCGEHFPSSFRIRKGVKDCMLSERTVFVLRVTHSLVMDEMSIPKPNYTYIDCCSVETRLLFFIESTRSTISTPTQPVVGTATEG